MRIVGRLFVIALMSSGCLSGGPTGAPPLQDFPPGGNNPGGVVVGGSGPIAGGPGGDFTEPVIVADSPPPPISGGTLVVATSGKIAAVSDPDHDQVLIVNLDKITLTATIALNAGDEPGRLVEDGAGRIHVALRGAGAIATIDPVSGAVLSRQNVCQYPRGLAYDAKADVIHVACAGGELVTWPAAGAAPTRQLKLDSDLRDVVIDGDHLLVSRFREAELLVVGADGQVSGRLKPAGIDAVSGDAGFAQGAFQPAVAWRTIAAPNGGALMVFQEEQSSDVQPQPGGYGGFGCGGIVRTAVSLLKVGGGGFTTPLQQLVLPVDIATSADGLQVDVASAASSTSTSLGNLPSVATFSALVPVAGSSSGVPPNPCGGGELSMISQSASQPIGQVVAVARDGTGRLLVQTREPFTLVVGDRAVLFPGDSRLDTGHQLFHLATSAGIACASCHPEGREDGHLWSFAGIGLRRTQSIGGGILGTEPFHWNGDMNDFATLAHEVFGSRMSGPNLKDAHVQALAGFIDKIPAWKPIPATDAAAVERGRALFDEPTAGCVTCHSGAKMTNNKSVDVGTGGMFQVPSLTGVVRRAPYLHQGCAPTLLDRFGPCGGDKHGNASTLTDGQRADLVSYLTSL